MVIANYLATELVDAVFIDPTAYSSVELLIALYGYAVQIYCDFSGYSDIAIGVAALLGYRFMKNFDQPYRAASLQEFWRRWHISLSQWLRDYLYKPLGGSQGSRIGTYRNLAVTMLLGGVWHGAAWTFIAWGAIHGFALAFERAMRERGDAVPGADPPAGGPGLRIVKILVTFHVVCLAWIFFRAENFETATAYIVGLGSLTAGLIAATPFLVTLIAIAIAGQFTPANCVERVARRIEPLPVPLMAFGFAGGLLAIYLVAPEGTAPFIYFQF